MVNIDKIKAIASEKGITITFICEAVSQKPYYLNDIKRNKRDIPDDRLQIIADILGTTPEYLRDETDIKEKPINTVVTTRELFEKFDNIFPLKTKKVPLLGDIACGKPIYADEDRESYVEAGTNVAADCCLRAKGDSMTGARINDGDIVFIREQPIVENGEIAAVIIDNEATLKRVFWYRESNKLVLQADNPKYEPLVFVGEELDKLTPTMIQRFYNKLLESGRCFAEGRKIDASNKGLSPKTIKNIHNVLHKALKQAACPPRGLIKYNPADAVELPKSIVKEKAVMTEEQISTLLCEMKDDWHYPIFYLDIFSGLRRGELLGLRWANVDFDNQRLTVTGQLQRERIKGGKLRIVPLKNNKTRTIYPPASVFEILKEHKAVQAELKDTILAAGGKWQDTGAVFTNGQGGWLEGSAVYRCLMKYMKKIGVDNVNLHGLRHTYATASISEGVDIKTLQESLGHHDPGFTLRVYGHTVDAMKKQAAQKMQDYAERINTMQNAERQD